MKQEYGFLEEFFAEEVPKVTKQVHANYIPPLFWEAIIGACASNFACRFSGFLGSKSGFYDQMHLC